MDSRIGYLVKKRRAAIALSFEVSLRFILMLSVLLYSVEAVVGTYGGYILGKKGYAIHAPINIGYSSDHKQEESRFKQRQKQAEIALQRDFDIYQILFDHYTKGNHPYRTHISDLDLSRDSEHPTDYKNRVYLDRNLFHSFKKEFQQGKEKEISEMESLDSQLYLYIKKNTPQYRINKLLGHFVLSQFSKGGYLFQVRTPQNVLSTDISQVLESLIPKKTFPIDSDMNIIFRNLMYEILQHEKQIVKNDIKLLIVPEHRILQRFVTALFSQTRLPLEIETDLNLIKDPNRLELIAGFIWLLARDDEWSYWQNFFKERAKKIGKPLEEYWVDSK